MQEKWRIAGDRAGSGNTANIGSIGGTIVDFSAGNGIFDSEAEFLEYWRGYKHTEWEREYDMPEASIETIRSAFFRPINIQREDPD